MMETSWIDGAFKKILILVIIIGVASYTASGIHAAFKSSVQPEIFDDAFMFVRYARNFLDGHGIVWNRGEAQVYGNTSMLHFFAVTLLTAALPSNPGTAVIIASWLPGLAAAVLLVHLCVLITRGTVRKNGILIWGAVVAVCMLMQGTTRFHSRTGMDTMLAFLCNTFVIYAAFRLLIRRHMGNVVITILASYLAYLARPDSGLYAVLFPAFAIWLLGGREWRRRALAIFCAGIAAVLAIDTIIKLAIFGDPVPLAFYAKRHGYYAAYAGIRLFNPFGFLRNFIITATPLMAITALFATRRSVRGLAALFIPVALTFLYLFTVIQIMGHCERYYFPSFPFFIAGAALAVNSYLEHTRGSLDMPFKKMVFGGIAIWAIVQFLIMGSGMGSRAYTGYFMPRTWPFRHRPSRFGPRVWPIDRRPFRTSAGYDLPLLDYWIPFTEMTAILSQLPDDTVIALSEYGYIGAMAPEKRLIDIVGLHDREFAHEGFTAEALFDRYPDIIWFPPMDYTTIFADLVLSDRFWEEYEFYPEALNLGLAVRRGSPHHGKIMVVLRTHWERIYPGYPMEQYRARRL